MLQRPALFVAPLILLLVWLGLSIALFFFGPILWPIPHRGPVAAFLAAGLGVIVTGYLTGAGFAPRPGKLRWPAVFVVGAVLTCALLFPSVYVYTGRLPWQILPGVFDQFGAYENFQNYLNQTGPLHMPVAVLRALSYPFVFAVVPLGILKWRELGAGMKILWGLSILTSILFSISRGTDREIMDVGTALLAGLLVLLGRLSARKMLRQAFAKSRLTFLVIASAAVLATIISAFVFVERKVERYEGAGVAITHLCIDGYICSDRDNALVHGLGERERFAVFIASSYIDQGYYGLSLALSKPFESTFGVGHSPLVARLATALTHNPALLARSYTSRMAKENQWNDQVHWSTLFTWLANDVGFPGSLFLVAFFTMLWAVAWRDAISGNDRAAIVFAILLQMLVWLPANNQIMQSPDSYLSFLVWITFWLYGRTHTAPAAWPPK